MCNLVKSSAKVDGASLILDLIKEASNHFRHSVQLNKDFDFMMYSSSYLSSWKDVVSSKRQGMKFQKVASLKKGSYLPNNFSHLLGLELQDSGDGVRLSNTLLVSFHTYEPVGPEKKKKVILSLDQTHLKASYVCVLGIINSSVVSFSKLPGSPWSSFN